MFVKKLKRSRVALSVLVLFIFLLLAPPAYGGWSELTSGSVENLNAIHFNDASTGYIVGTNGTVLKTTDGSNWSDQSPGGNNLTGIHIFSTGSSFENLSTYTEVDPGNIITVNPNGSRYEALVDGNSDNTTGSETYLYFDYGAGHFDDTAGFEHLFEFELSVSGQAKNWECPWVVSNVLDQYINLNSGYSVCMWEQNNGSPVVEIYNNNTGTYDTASLASSYVSPTSVYGKVTVTPGGNATAYFYSDVARTSLITSMAVAASAASYRYLYAIGTDIRWMYLNSMYSRNLDIQEDTGYASSGGGTVLRTTSAGISWVADTADTSSLEDLFFVDANTGWTVGLAGTIRKTTDGGATWANQTTGTANLESVHMIDASNGFVAGSGGTIMETINGGTNWNARTSNTANDLKSIFFIDANAGWAVGKSDTIVKTTNGGTNWAVQTAPTSGITFNSVYFIDANIGWAVGSNDTIIKTTDGGSNWGVQTSPTTGINLIDIQMIDVNTGYISGASGKILKTTDGGGPIGSTISGRVFEDADFVGTASGWDGGTNDFALQNVDVELYDNSNVYQASTTTDASGNYSFTGLVDGTYKVRIRSATIGDADTPPKGGFNACVPGTCAYGLPEMTWGNGSAVYGGQDPEVDDTATADNGGPGDTWVSVTVSGGDVTGVDFGVAFNFISNTGDDANDAVTISKQGSLRQFIKNANAINNTGTITSEFRIPATDTNYQTSGTDNWWRITASADMTPIIDGDLTINARTQAENVANANSQGPEIEIQGGGSGTGSLTVSNAANVTIRDLIMNRMSSVSAVIFTGASSTNGAIYGCYLGTNQFGEDLGGGAKNYNGILITSGAANIVIGSSTAGSGNVISGSSNVGIRVSSATNITIQNNKVGTNASGTSSVPNGIGTNNRAGVRVQGSSDNVVIGGSGANEGNVISGNAANGIESYDTPSNLYIYGNYIGVGADGTTSIPNQFTGLKLYGASGGSIIYIGGETAGQGNIIANNGQNGIWFTPTDTGDYQIKGNTIYNSTQNGIKLDKVNAVIAMNLLYGNGTGGTYDGIMLNNVETGTYTKLYHNTINSSTGDGIDVAHTGATLTNNIITGSGGYGINRTAASMTESYNLVTDNVTNPANTSGQSNVALDATDINADPEYVNSGSGDYTLTECSSSAINAGVDLGADQPDVNGATAGNYNSIAPDLGAFESSCAAPPLTLYKTAFLADGTAIATGTVLPRGTVVKYLIYINNQGSARSDVSVQDVLAAAFVYQSGTIKIDNSVAACAAQTCTSGEEGTIFTAVDGKSALTDGVDADEVSFAAGTTTIDAGNQNVANGQLDIAANKVWAMQISVKIQ